MKCTAVKYSRLLAVLLAGGLFALAASAENLTSSAAVKMASTAK